MNDEKRTVDDYLPEKTTTPPAIDEAMRPVFEVELDDGTNFVISRTTPASVMKLCVLPERRTYYILGKSGKPLAANRPNMAYFMNNSDTPSVHLEYCQWCSEVPLMNATDYTGRVSSAMADTFTDEALMRLCRYGVCFVSWDGNATTKSFFPYGTQRHVNLDLARYLLCRYAVRLCVPTRDLLARWGQYDQRRDELEVCMHVYDVAVDVMGMFGIHEATHYVDAMLSVPHIDDYDIGFPIDRDEEEPTHAETVAADTIQALGAPALIGYLVNSSWEQGFRHTQSAWHPSFSELWGIYLCSHAELGDKGWSIVPDDLIAETARAERALMLRTDAERHPKGVHA